MAAAKTPHEHTTLFLHVLLEEKCLNDALHLLNDSPKRQRNFTKDDAEVKAVAKKLHEAMSSQFKQLGFGVPDTQDAEFTSNRDLYRTGLDYLQQQALLSLAADGNVEIAVPSNSMSLAVNNRTLSTSTSRTANVQVPALVSSTLLASFQQQQEQRLLEMARLNLPVELRSIVDPVTFRANRYQNAFREVGLLGSGGFGRVYLGWHNHSQMPYAVKKIPLGRKIQERINRKGRSALVALFNEFRAMAALDHPNVVRYHDVWLEGEPSRSSDEDQGSSAMSLSDSYEGSTYESPMVTSGLQEGSYSVGPRGLSHVRMIASPTDDVSLATSTHSARAPQPSMPAGMILFGEDSGDQVNVSRSEGAVESSENGSCSTHRSRSRRTSGLGSASEEEIETIDRNVAELDLIQNAPGGPKFIFENSNGRSQPPVPLQITDKTQSRGLNAVLYIQMAYYPLSLSDYLKPVSERGNAKFVNGSVGHASHSAAVEALIKSRHCFHFAISIRIILCLLKGVMYLHSSEFAHRDLKPANILLTALDRHEAAHGCVNIVNCPDCPPQEDANGDGAETDMKTGKEDSLLESEKDNKQQAKESDLDSNAEDDAEYPLFINLRIGDFGLVTALANPNSSSSTAVVGTPPYCPHSAPRHSNAKLDVFALGIILVELLTPFATNMERLLVLHQVRDGDGVLPEEMHKRFAEMHGGLPDVLSGMLRKEEEERVGCAHAKRALGALLS